MEEKIKNDEEGKENFITFDEVKKELENTQRKLDEVSLGALVKVITKAKEANINVSDIEAQMPELKKQVFRAEVEDYLERTKKTLDYSTFYFLVISVENAKEANVDVSDIEAQMPELKKQVIYADADKWLKKTQGADIDLKKYCFNTFVKVIAEAKKAEVDVSDIEAQMPELKKQIFCAMMEYWIERSQTKLDEYNFVAFVKAMVRAKEGGYGFDDISDIEAQIPELKKRVFRANADRWLEKTQKKLNEDTFDILVVAVAEAKKAEVDVSDIEAQMPELKKQIKK